MKPLSKDVRDLIGKAPEAKDPDTKKVVEQKTSEVKLVAKVNTKQICQNCKAYSRKTKMCNGLKFVPRKRTCTAFDTVTK